jgi:hypothetical protein
MRRALSILALSTVPALAACEDAGASVQIDAATATRAPDGRVAVDVVLAAEERLGGNVGKYCTRATFAGQAVPAEVCDADLRDGDTRAVRLVSDGAPAASSPIGVRVRLGAVDIGRSLVAPP